MLSKEAKYIGKSANPIEKVSKASTQENLMNMLRNCDDPHSLEVLSRIKNIDLLQVKARYHRSCVRALWATATRKKVPVGRNTVKVDTAMECVYNYLKENADDCQFALRHLMEKIPPHCRFTAKTLKDRLLAKYGDEIVIYNVNGVGNVVCFKQVGRQLLSEAWYSTRLQDKNAEKERVVREAAAIVREQICSKLYDIEEYPSTNEFLDGAEEDVPSYLRIFLEEIIFAKKRKDSLPSWKKQVISIAHAIIEASRPRCFLSKVLLGVGCFLKKKFSSRLLVDTLAAIGFSCSYSEVELLELSCISRKQPEVSPTGFSQWVADNADFNINTLDGRGSWHVMALIQCVTPKSSIKKEEPMHRQVQNRKSIHAGELGNIELIPYDYPPSAGLDHIKVEKLDMDISTPIPILPTGIDLMWVYGKWMCNNSVPGWNGFMEQVTEGLPFETSRILYFPFINAPPTDNTTVHTTLLQICKVGELSSQATKFVTFDQQLYWKARDIVGNAPADSELKQVVVRLGGFHLLMSFMGSIGNIMSGSGLENLWSTMHAEGSIPQMLLEKAYERAVRAHILSNLSIAKIIFDLIDREEPTFYTLRDSLDDVLADADRTHVLSLTL